MRWALVCYAAAALLALLWAVGPLIGLTVTGQLLPWVLLLFIAGHLVG